QAQRRREPPRRDRAQVSRSGGPAEPAAGRVLPPHHERGPFMGKLRTSIDNVSKTAATMEKAVETLLDTRTKEIDNFMHATDMCRGGGEVMYMYLMEKYKKEGKKIEAQQNDTIKDVLDAKVASMIKGVVEGHAKVVKLIEERDKTMKVGTAVKTNATK